MKQHALNVITTGNQSIIPVHVQALGGLISGFIITVYLWEDELEEEPAEVLYEDEVDDRQLEPHHACLLEDLHPTPAISSYL